jgi:ATP-dependent DNA helicase PIF1
MTINNSQGQTLGKVGLYLERPVFSHGQLYVGASRVSISDDLKLYLGSVTERSSPAATSNIVFTEIFHSSVLNGGAI